MTDQAHEFATGASGSSSRGRPVGFPFRGDADLPALDDLLASCADQESTKSTRMLFTRSQPGERLGLDTGVARLWVGAVARPATAGPERSAGWARRR